MNINANPNSIMSTAVARKNGSTFTVRSPLANFAAQEKDRMSALTKFVEMLGALMFAQQRSLQSSKGPGRPSKNYENLHVQVPAGVKAKLSEISAKYNLSQGEAVAFMLNCYELLDEEFVPIEDMQEAELNISSKLTATV